MTVAADWGPDWLRLEDGSGLHLPSLRPCGCGNTRFTITVRGVAREGGTPLLTCAVICLECLKLRQGEVVRGTIDVRTRRISS